MTDIDLGQLLKREYSGTLRELADKLACGDSAGAVTAAATLVTTLATGHPEIAILAPFAKKAVGQVFGRSANARFMRALQAMEKEEEKQAFVGQIAEAVEVLLGQAVLQMVRVSHRVKEEELEAMEEKLGGMREELRDFRASFERELGAGIRDALVHVDEQVVREGSIGIRVSSDARRGVFVRRMEVTGKSIGIDLK